MVARARAHVMGSQWLPGAGGVWRRGEPAAVVAEAGLSGHLEPRLGRRLLAGARAALRDPGNFERSAGCLDRCAVLAVVLRVDLVAPAVQQALSAGKSRRSAFGLPLALAAEARYVGQTGKNEGLGAFVIFVVRAGDRSRSSERTTPGRAWREKGRRADSAWSRGLATGSANGGSTARAGDEVSVATGSQWRLAWS